MSECLRCKAREINGTLTAYDVRIAELKAKADKLAEALEAIADWDEGGDGYAIAMRALKEYGGK